MTVPDAAPLTLAIEVSNPSAEADAGRASGGGGGDVTGPSVALARGGAVFEQEALRTPDSRHDDDLMPAIDRMVRRAGLSPGDLERVAISIGPGGFTGLRVAVATAKAIGEAIIAQRGLSGEAARVCIGVRSAQVVAGNFVRTAGVERRIFRFAVALASKRDSAWVAWMGAAGRREALMNAEAIAAMHAADPIRVLLADRFLPDPMRTWAAGAGVAVEPPVFSAASCAREAALVAPVDPEALLPLYPREPEAVTKWRELKKEP